MKIGVLTLPLHTNYGGILQAWSLQTVLERRGHEVYMLSYNKRNISILAIIKAIKEFVLSPIYPNARKWELMSFKRFESQQFTKWIKLPSKQNNDLQAIIVGSDQVWRSWGTTWPLPFYFLDFAKDWDIKRYSYAASFGTDSFNAKPEEIEYCVNLAQKFDGISVREIDGIEICKNYFGKKALHVLDPTMLLDMSDFLTLADIDKEENKGLAVFLLDNDEEKQAIVDCLEKKFQKVIKPNDSAIKRKGLTKYTCWATVEQWIQVMSNAEFVITDSFHGTAFSINFEKDFVVLPNTLRGQARLHSILKMFGLEDRIVKSQEEALLTFEKKIDWSQVRKTKLVMRKLSFDFLDKL